MYYCYASCPSCAWTDLPTGETLEEATRDALRKHRAKSPTCTANIALSILPPDPVPEGFIFQGYVTPNGERYESDTVSYGIVSP